MNVAPNWANTVGTMPSRSGTEPMRIQAAAMYVTTEASRAAPAHSQLASRIWSKSTSTSCGMRKYAARPRPTKVMTVDFFTRSRSSSSTVSRPVWSLICSWISFWSPFCFFIASRVAPLNARGWIRDAASATASAPMPAIAFVTARSAPMTVAVDVRSSATSDRSWPSVAASSANPKSMSQGSPSAARKTFARRRSRWAVRRSRSPETRRQTCCSTASVRSSGATPSSDDPSIIS